MSEVIVITGASQGIGRAAAEALAAKDHELVLVARRRPALERVAVECETAGARTLVRCLDVQDESAVKGLFDGLERVDALVNCAGFGRFGATDEEDTASFDRSLAVNLRGVYLCCKHAIRRMLTQGSGRIVNVLSIAAKVPFAASAAYCASKWGALGLTLSLAAEYRTRGIKVTALMPGSVDTPFWDSQTWRPKRDRMLPAKDVGAAIAQILSAPDTMNIDELVIMPPDGIL